MKRFIRYLYECEQGKRIRNVGFVKVETGSERTTLHVQAKGFKEGGDRRLVLYLFYKDKEELISLCREQMTIVSPALNYCMAYEKNDVGSPENYEKIKGILIVTESGRRIAATWDDKPVDVSSMKEFETAVMGAGHKEEKSGAEPQEEARLSPAVLGGGREEEKSGAEPQEEAELSPSKGEKKITKIQRQDISRLTHCEWKLANNQFLIHGYNNYHYLVLIEEENVLKLGVPGIYHIKEEKYAEMFGFGEFLPEDEMFGYWCRPVKQRQSRQH